MFGFCYPVAEYKLYKQYKLQDPPKKEKKEEKKEEPKQYRMFDQEAYHELYGAPAPAAVPMYMASPTVTYPSSASVIYQGHVPFVGCIPSPQPEIAALPPAAGNIWCKELDTSWTVRKMTEIGSLQPGKFVYDADYVYFVREKKKD